MTLSGRRSIYSEENIPKIARGFLKRIYAKSDRFGLTHEISQLEEMANGESWRQLRQFDFETFFKYMMKKVPH